MSGFYLVLVLVILGSHVSVLSGVVMERARTGGVTTGEDPARYHLSSPSVQHIRWAEAAYSYIRTLDCREAFFTTEKECNNLQQRSKSDLAIYVADPTPFGRLVGVLPDGGLSRAGAHDAVLVVDPYPRANFGHLVLAFYIDMYTTRLYCHREGGMYLDDGDCFVLALKKRCKNALERRSRRRNFARRCEVNFLPLVYKEGDGRQQQRLSCRSNLPGFSPCPTLRPRNETSSLVCNPLRDNTKRCETTHEKIHTSCRVLEICDQAVILSGGWNRFSSLPHNKDNILSIYRMLRNHGFKRKNIEIFFANGIKDGLEVGDETAHEVHPAAMKIAMRYHIQSMCGSLHCVDSLVFYLNSPTKSDGSMLLWDTDADGIAEEKERYSLEELLSDLADCQARQVHVIADQSYSGEIARAVKRSHRHHNVAVFTSSKDHEYSYGNEYTQLWASANHTHTCAQDVHREIRRQMHFSTPESEQGKRATHQTIFGAPCDVTPPFSHKELRQNYLGCQNLPTALWVIKFLGSSKESEGSDSTTQNPSLSRYAG